jgi:hypothetical protein
MLSTYLRSGLMAVLCLSFILVACETDLGKKVEESVPTTELPQGEDLFAAAAANDPTPVPFPDTGIPGFNFPEDSSVINAWIANRDEVAIHQHAWGIWTGLTKVIGKTCNGDNLRVFETWHDPEYLADRMQGKPIATSGMLACGRPPLTMPSQFGHAVGVTGTTEGINDSIFESVVYSPAAAAYALENRIFSKQVQDSLYGAGVRNMKFPVNAITAKPVFKVIPRKQIDQGAYAIEVWPGPVTPPAPVPEDSWNNYAYVIKDDSQPHDGLPDGSVYTLADFIHFELTEDDITYFESEFFAADSKDDFSVGDYAILVGMHVSSREAFRWTWQTFYWTPNPDQPTLPSSPLIASLRPRQLTGAPAHYALTAAYNMIWPAQPYVGGQSVGEPIYSYNPYLEAPFTEGTLGSSPVTLPNGKIIDNKYGIQTNCMSCHIQATVIPTGSSAKHTNPYRANTYISMDDEFFRGKLMTDFAYSVGATTFSDTLK